MNVSVEEILAAKRREVAALPASFPARVRPRLDFEAALRRPHRSVIAEIKRSSPSQGEFGVEPAALKAAYLEAGADCFSILTDVHFGMTAADLVELARDLPVPVLRKDFVLDARQIDEADSIGADAVLLIATFLSSAELDALGRHAAARGLAVLYEAHGAEDLAKMPSHARIIGINNRDLADPRYGVDRQRSKELLQKVPDGVIKVAESGYGSGSELPACDAVLIGAGLIREFKRKGNVTEMIEELQRRGTSR